MTAPDPDSANEMDARKARAAGWFRELRDTIVADFEALEDGVTGPSADRPAGSRPAADSSSRSCSMASFLRPYSQMGFRGVSSFVGTTVL